MISIDPGSLITTGNLNLVKFFQYQSFIEKQVVLFLIAIPSDDMYIQLIVFLLVHCYFLCKVMKQPIFRHLNALSDSLKW